MLDRVYVTPNVRIWRVRGQINRHSRTGQSNTKSKIGGKRKRKLKRQREEEREKRQKETKAEMKEDRD